MRWSLIFSILGLLVATLLRPAAGSAETLHLAQDDQTASAHFSSTDLSGCVLTEVSVIAVDGRRKDGQEPGEERSEAIAAISRYDACADALLLAADGRAALAPEAFQIDDLTAATLNATIELFDSVSNSSLAVDVALTWQGVGDPVRQRIHTHIWTRSFTVNFRFDGTDRQAAAAGTVMVGTDNVTPEPGVDNSLRAIRAGQVTVRRT
jgi:hypothetical protein